MPTISLARGWLTILVLAAAAPAIARVDDPPADVTTPPPYADFVVIPLRVHVLTSKDLPEADCALADADIARIVGKVNGIWHNAGVHWGLESIVREPVAQAERFKEARDQAQRPPLTLFRMLRPDDSQVFDGVHVYYIHKFSVNGVYLGDRVAFVQETAKLRPVEGGIDEPIPRVTAHELGHALSLPHRQDRTNLLASGTTGTLLNAAEVAQVRAAAKAIKGSSLVDDLRQAAAQAAQQCETQKARQLWTWLAEIPGDGALEAKKRLRDLRDEL